MPVQDVRTDDGDLLRVQSECRQAWDSDDAEEQQVVDIDEITQSGNDDREAEQGSIVPVGFCRGR